jgi:hypothetical protein
MNWERSDRFEEWQGCRVCAYYRRARCIAYPDGIPLVILSGEVDHMVPRPGQVGDTVFEPMDWDVFARTRRRVPAAR